MVKGQIKKSWTLLPNRYCCSQSSLKYKTCNLWLLRTSCKALQKAQRVSSQFDLTQTLHFFLQGRSKAAWRGRDRCKGLSLPLPLSQSPADKPNCIRIPPALENLEQRYPADIPNLSTQMVVLVSRVVFGVGQLVCVFCFYFSSSILIRQ